MSTTSDARQHLHETLQWWKMNELQRIEDPQKYKWWVETLIKNLLLIITAQQEEIEALHGHPSILSAERRMLAGSTLPSMLRRP